GALVVVHAEDPGSVRESPPSPRYADFVASRPPAAERSAVATVVAAARRTGARVHVLHLSSAGALPELVAARADGVRLTVETCPHYLALTAEQVPDGATEFKCCPPIRDRGNQDRLWAALADGTVDCVVSDHSPCLPELKRADTGDFAAAWGGIASVQLSLPVVWTQARRRGHGLADVVRWMATGPADLVGLRGKGRIAVGADADLVALRRGRGLPRRAGPAAPPAPRDAVRRPAADRGGAGHLAARRTGHRRRPARPAAAGGCGMSNPPDPAPPRPADGAQPDLTDLTALPDLASRAFGGGVVAANAEFFAAADNLVDPLPPTFSPRTFAAKGQV
ncbi:amidohydrolase family protein, partial [Micromonospora sp. DH15]|nr:amidohydrolase family protein [Micromonospora sp. DH15]